MLRSSITGRFVRALRWPFGWVQKLFTVREERKWRDVKIGGTD